MRFPRIDVINANHPTARIERGPNWFQLRVIARWNLLVWFA